MWLKWVNSIHKMKKKTREPQGYPKEILTKKIQAQAYFPNWYNLKKMCRIAIFFMNWNFRYFPTALLINHWPYLKCTGACFYHQMWNSLYMYILLKVLDSTHSFEIALMYYLQPFTLAGDLTNEDFVRQLVDDTVKHYGKLDILVCIVDLIWTNFTVQNKRIRNKF